MFILYLGELKQVEARSLKVKEVRENVLRILKSRICFPLSPDWSGEEPLSRPPVKEQSILVQEVRSVCPG